MKREGRVYNAEKRGARLLEALSGIVALILFMAVCAACFLFAGCVYTGAKVTEGTDLAVGISVPGTDGALQLQVFNYLSGFRLGVAEDAQMTVEYTTTETNDYFGCIHTRVHKTVKATVSPTEKDAADEPASTANAATEKINEGTPDED